VVDWFFQQIQANSSFLNSTLNLEQVTTPASNPTPTSTQNQ
jgi:cvpA family protein